MLDLGFVVPIRKILLKLPKQRQSLFFSATMPKEIAGLAADMLRNPKEVAVAPVATTAEEPPAASTRRSDPLRLLMLRIATERLSGAQSRYGMLSVVVAYKPVSAGSSRASATCTVWV